MQTTQDEVIELGHALQDVLREILKTPPGQLLLRFVDWYPWLKRRPWVRDL